MKRRSSFVSNSSSASFIIQTNEFNEERLIKKLNSIVESDERWSPEKILTELKTEINWLSRSDIDFLSPERKQELIGKANRFKEEIQLRLKTIKAQEKKKDAFLRNTELSQLERRNNLNEVLSIISITQETLATIITEYLLGDHHIEIVRDGNRKVLLKKYFSMYNGISDFPSYLKEIIAHLTMYGSIEEIRVEDDNDGSASGIPIIRMQSVKTEESTGD